MWPSMTTSPGQRPIYPSRKGSGSRLSITRECPFCGPQRRLNSVGVGGPACRAELPAEGGVVPVLQPPSSCALACASCPLSAPPSLLLFRWPSGGRWTSGVYTLRGRPAGWRLRWGLGCCLHVRPPPGFLLRSLLPGCRHYPRLLTIILHP